METITCPRCGKIGQVRADYLGRSVKCKSCGSDFVAAVLDESAPVRPAETEDAVEQIDSPKRDEPNPKVAERLLCAVCRTEIDHPNPFGVSCPHCAGRHGRARMRRIGRPGEVWRNTTRKF